MNPRLALARIGPRWRLAAAAACLLLAAVSAVEGRATPGHTTTTRVVVVAARDLPVGRLLTGHDLTIVRGHDPWPGAMTSPRGLIGHRLTGTVRRGEPLTAERLVSPRLTRGLAPGVVAFPVDVATDVRGLAEPGGRVDLLAVPAPDAAADTPDASGGPAGRAVATGLLVLAALPPPSGGDDGCRLILAAARDTAVKIAALRSSRLFQAVALPP